MLLKRHLLLHIKRTEIKHKKSYQLNWKKSKKEMMLLKQDFCQGRRPGSSLFPAGRGGKIVAIWRMPFDKNMIKEGGLDCRSYLSKQVCSILIGRRVRR